METLKTLIRRAALPAAVLFALVLSSSCRGSKALLPNVSGKAGEVIVVIEKANWEGDLGTAVRDLLGGDCPYLMQREPLYNLVNIAPGGFAEILRVHRNILMFRIDPQNVESGVQYRSDVWAHPQRVIVVNAKDSAEALSLFGENSEKILSSIEQAERDRIIANSILYEEASFRQKVVDLAGGSPHFPTGYKWKTGNDSFIWIADEKQYVNQGIFIYKYPAGEAENFTVENIVANRNRILQENVPGMFENTYMTTQLEVAPPTVEFIRFRGRQFAQTRGFWEVKGDFMGGPFVSHSFYSKDNRYIIVVEGWVYAPRFDKRQYLRQVEAIVYSFEWDEKQQSGEGADDSAGNKS